MRGWWRNWYNPAPPTTKLTWVEILDSYDKDPSSLQHELRMDWLYMNVPMGSYSYTSHSDDFFNGTLRCYGFANKSHAVMFKLSWAGDV